MNITLEQKIDLIIENHSLILSELLKLNTKLDRQGTKLDERETKFNNQDSKIDSLRLELSSLKAEMNAGFKEILAAITFIGNKVFDNHERRIGNLENLAHLG